MKIYMYIRVEFGLNIPLFDQNLTRNQNLNLSQGQ